ncbi:hemocyte protein-glutamine gamma-glutamyltransferase-like isoform X1 [Aphidius gifuensis]|uniref:hemocyte protein-glutamine gamma-glutamyltransferase-like isoform X1 n=1 Tax=Aphidius gifuensis TaxID=684658 RepID=UPI001CDC0A64|nr:hemocyte protein-glutamine gamma-glutamyltransferase-like isoform X1 [Aphidius gifuensis]
MESTDALVVDTVYMFEKENASLHNTENFELIHADEPTPILRRGQEFSLTIRFNRDYIEQQDIVRLLFNFGSNPNVFKGTRGVNTITNRNNYLSDLEAWSVRIIDVSGIDLSIEVRSPIDSPVGIWQFNIETTISGSKEPPNIYQYDKDIYLLFNPWLKDDLVYMEDEQLLGEYVQTDVGKIWVGPNGSARGREWIFGQFDASVLPACMLMFDKSDIKATSRGDPVMVARTISKMVNAYNANGYKEELNGILFGRWDGDYIDGVAPSAWTGSVPILEQYLDTNGECVKYGQCWVFAGVVGTICRALGLPTRVVTNIVSAHDTNVSLSIDHYYDENMQELPGESYDSVWNYHVWNDVWMARPDLPKGYGGWQAVDGTPQEESNGVYRCGPASVEAIKQGAVGFNYDVTFLVSTVNADVINWKADPTNDLGYTRINGDTKHIGRMLLTKAPWIFDPNGDKDKEDITYEYKSPEGTDAERLTLYRAVRNTPTAKRYYAVPAPENEDLIFKLEDLERVNIGEPFNVTVNITNKSSELRTVRAILWAGSVYYNGVKANLVKRAEGTFVMEPNVTEQLKLHINVDDYLDELVEYSIMKINAIATVQETNQTWADEDDFQVIKPKIKIEIDNEPIVGRPSAVTLSFNNPLKKMLHDCVFNYAGPGVSKNKTIHFRDVEPLEEVRIQHQFIPQKEGKQKIIATFTSKELDDVTGSVEVEVLKEDEDEE